MDDKKVQDIQQTDVYQITPQGAPSENYLVAEKLQRMPSLFSRGLLYLVILFLLSGLVYSLLGKIDVVAQCRAIATPAASPLNIQASGTGYVERVYVSEGQQVEKNSPLFLISSRTMPRTPPDVAGPLTDTNAASPAALEGKAPATATETVVTSPAEGTVVRLFITYPGAYVEESAPLCNILPAFERLAMDIRATNREIGFIQTGMAIKYKFDAFPYTDYGVLYGRVTSIPSAAVEDTREGLVFHVQGTLDRAYFECNGETYFLRAGMTAAAELVRERVSIFNILFKSAGT